MTVFGEKEVIGVNSKPEYKDLYLPTRSHKEIKVGKVVDGIWQGIEIPRYIGKAYPLEKHEQFWGNEDMSTMGNLDLVALAINTNDRLKLMSRELRVTPCLLEYGQNEWVLGYKRENKYWFFNARVTNPFPGSRSYNPFPDIAVKPLEGYMGYFVTTLPPGYSYEIFVKRDGDWGTKNEDILCIYNHKTKRYFPASL